MSRSLWAVSALAVALVVAAAMGGCGNDAQERLARARNAVFEKDPDLALEQYRLALDVIERDIERNGSAAARVLQARALKGAADVYYLELRDFRRAVEVYQELIRQCPEAPETLEGRIRLAEILHAHFGDLRGAIGALTAAVERNAPESAELIYKVAKLYFELGDYEQVTLEAQRVQTRFETSAFVDDAMFLEAQALAMMEGRTRDAQRTLEQLVERFEDSVLVPHALFEMGKLEAEAGERERAIELWVRALDRHPDPAVVQSSISRVRRQIIERSPAAIGQRAVALDRPVVQAAPYVPVVHKTSIEAAGGTAEEAAQDRPDRDSPRPPRDSPLPDAEGQGEGDSVAAPAPTSAPKKPPPPAQASAPKTSPPLPLGEGGGEGAAAAPTPPAPTPAPAAPAEDSL